jgi:phosphohistidine phosphatase
MHTLYLLRHAKSSWADQGLPDHERPLAPRGRRDGTRIANHLVRLGIEPGLVLCSSAERTRETLELLRPALGATAAVRVEEDLYAASCERLLERIRALPEAVASLLVIGHNPGLQQLGLFLASTGAELERLEAKFPTAALATLTIPDTTWSRLSKADAVLAAYVVPKQLG